ncbi:MAG: cytochrome c, partial [Actinomycetota bacterium]|nr:cytochrome c [Actinomycetota bacterium]
PTVPRTPPPPPPPATTPLPRRSAVAELFANNCGVCHALKAAGTSGRIGPDLDKLEPSRLRVLRAISYGGSGSGVMPARILAGPQATRVAAYVARVSRR